MRTPVVVRQTERGGVDVYANIRWSLIYFERMLFAVVCFVQDLQVRGSVHVHPGGGNRKYLNKYAAGSKS